MPQHSYSKIDFDGSAMCRITVKGLIDEFYSECLGDMHIGTQRYKGGSVVTILHGTVRDQAELLGILTGIYEVHLPILSVELWKGKE